jgi:tripartite-type tricarboxylate transporter receptor subunit TctC
MASLRFNDMAGIETRYVQGGGSAKRAQLMAGGTIDYTLSSTLTLEKFGSLGLRGLAYMSDRRHPRFRLSGTAPA